MKTIYIIISIILINHNFTFAQQKSITHREGMQTVTVNSPSGLNMIIPLSNGNNSGIKQENYGNPVQNNVFAFNWVLQFTAPGKVFKDVSFANTQVGYIVTELGSVYKTTNGGNNWTSVMNLGFPYYWYGVHALTIDTVVIAGFNDQDSIRRGAMRWTFNGGTTWTSDIVLQRPTNGVGWLDHVHFYNQNNGIVMNGLTGACYYTTTGGKSASAWNFVQINADLGWFGESYDFQPSGNVYASGIDFAKSTDFGVTWATVPHIDAVFDGGADFLDQNNLYGWIGGGEISPSVAGWTHETTDGGNTWGPRQMTFSYPIRAVKFYDQNNGFAIGGNVQSEIGGIYSTSNGGNAWNLEVNTSAEMFSLDYKSVSPDSMDVWVVGSTGVGTGFTGKVYKARMMNLVGIRPISSEVPSLFRLYQNYPNPFNPRTVINYQVPVNSFVKISVFDVTGKLIGNLVNQNQNAGTYAVDFDASNLSSGIYFYKIEVRQIDGGSLTRQVRSTTGDFADVKKMVLVK